MRPMMQLCVRSAAMAGGILFIFALASTLSFALTIEQLSRLVSSR